MKKLTVASLAVAAFAFTLPASAADICKTQDKSQWMSRKGYPGRSPSSAVKCNVKDGCWEVAKTASAWKYFDPSAGLVLSSSERQQHVGGHVTRPNHEIQDIGVFHWSLVAAIACEFAFRAGTAIHNTVGYIVLGLIAFRLLWGFAGTSHARFADFVKSPTETLAYVWSILRGHPPRS
jgi:hypothetical protein